MSLLRCPWCRYSFEHAGEERPTKCQQCGGRLDEKSDEPRPDPGEHKPTQKMRTIPKPEE